MRQHASRRGGHTRALPPTFLRRRSAQPQATICFSFLGMHRANSTSCISPDIAIGPSGPHRTGRPETRCCLDIPRRPQAASPACSTPWQASCSACTPPLQYIRRVAPGTNLLFGTSKLQLWLWPARNGDFSARMRRALRALRAALLLAYYYSGAPFRATGAVALLARSCRMRTVHLPLNARRLATWASVRTQPLHRSWVCTHCASVASWRHA